MDITSIHPVTGSAAERRAALRADLRAAATLISKTVATSPDVVAVHYRWTRIHADLRTDFECFRGDCAAGPIETFKPRIAWEVADLDALGTITLRAVVSGARRGVLIVGPGYALWADRGDEHWRDAELPITVLDRAGDTAAFCSWTPGTGALPVPLADALRAGGATLDPGDAVCVGGPSAEGSAHSRARRARIEHALARIGLSGSDPLRRYCKNDRTDLWLARTPPDQPPAALLFTTMRVDSRNGGSDEIRAVQALASLPEP